MNEIVREYLASLGRVGGKTKGAVKRRGDAAYYAELGRKSAASKKAKREVSNPPAVIAAE